MDFALISVVVVSNSLALSYNIRRCDTKINQFYEFTNFKYRTVDDHVSCLLNPSRDKNNQLRFAGGLPDQFLQAS